MKEINEELQIQLLNFDSEKRKKWMQQRLPFSVLFELTPVCNMSCIHCYLQKHHSEDMLTFSQIKHIIDILYNKGILFLTFTGGEIFTRSDFLDIYMYAKKKGFLVELFSNGYLIDESIIKVLKEYPPLLVDISLYGANEATYKKITGISGAFDRVVENCKKLREENIRVSLKSPIIKDTLPDLEKMKSLAENLGVPFTYTFEITPTIDKDESPQKYRIPLDTALSYEFDNYYDQLRRGERNKISNYNEIMKDLTGSDSVYFCNVALNSFVIDYRGRMCPCMKLRHKGISLFNNEFDKIWEEFAIYSRKKASATYICTQCDAKYYCDICPAEMDFLYGDEEYRPEEACKIAKIRKAFYENEVSYKEALCLARNDREVK